MSTTSEAMNGAGPSPFSVLVPARSFKNELRAIKVVWHREILRFLGEKPRIVSALLQPMLYLFVLGSGLGTMIPSSRGVNLPMFMFPGVIAMAVLFTCFFSAGSVVWDRELGFMREMLVAPIRRSSIVLGKALGGATVGTFQGVLVFALAGLVGVPYAPGLMLIVLAELMLLSFTLTALGLVIAARLRTFQAFMAVVQMLLMPLFFLSGALYPLEGLPRWLAIATRLDPITYAVDPLRRAILSYALDGRAAHGHAVGVTWGTWVVPVPVELGIVALFGVVAVAISAIEFNRME